jgi:hypothetical protein
MRRYLSPIYPGPHWTDEEVDEDLKRTMEEMRDIASDDTIINRTMVSFRSYIT